MASPKGECDLTLPPWIFAHSPTSSEASPSTTKSRSFTESCRRMSLTTPPTRKTIIPFEAASSPSVLRSAASSLVKKESIIIRISPVEGVPPKL